MTTRKRPTPVERLMAAMDRCAVARGEAQWTRAYRTAKGGAFTESQEGARLFAKEMTQWDAAARAEAAFRRLAQRLTRSAQ